MALLQALLHPFGYGRRDEAPELFQVRSSKGLLRNSSLHNIIIEPKECLRRLLRSRIIAPEPSHEDRLIAVGIELRMHGALRVDGHLVRVDSVGYAVCAVLENELRNEAALDDGVDLGAAGMAVRGVETTRTEEGHCHAYPGANEGWEVFTIRAYEVATLAACDSALWWVVEVEDEVGVVGDEIDAVFLKGRECECLNYILVVGDTVRLLYIWQGSGVINRRWKRKSKDAELGTDEES